ncbi:MAG TPA: L-threonylcarbamoyladenylate synthase [Flavisolibacter sp.]|jgi:L-threonylcarbamoyladenylate synthase|nr:L-threonylcarbamoyladenylate synthase [Flavisolibacter sp.]
MEIDFAQEVEAALVVLRNGGVLLYPTDTIWGLGCDATNDNAVQKIYHIKQRNDSKSLIILVADEREILQYVAAPDLAVFDFIEQQQKPTTVIFDGAINLPDNLIAEDGSIAIRIVQDNFCRHLIKRLRKPVVSTSANISGEPSPMFYDEISSVIKDSVTHIVQWRQADKRPSQPSQIVRWKADGSYHIVRS